MVVPIIDIDEWVPADHELELRSREDSLDRSFRDYREESFLYAIELLFDRFCHFPVDHEIHEELLIGVINSDDLASFY